MPPTTHHPSWYRRSFFLNAYLLCRRRFGVASVILSLLPVDNGEHILRANAALDSPVLVHVHLGPLHLMDEASETPDQ